MAQDNRLLRKEIQLKGKLITSVDPSAIGENFRQLTNMRYTDTHPKGIGGMEKINNTALTNAKIRSGFHFVKESPQESHVLVQSFNSGQTQGYIYTNKGTIPNSADFSATVALTQGSSAVTAQWSYAPSGDMCMCDQAGTYVWGGDEQRVARFVTSTATVDNTLTNARDYTKQMQNSLQTSEQLATIGGGDDANTIVLLHCDGPDGEQTFDNDGEAGGGTGNGTCKNTHDYSKFGAGCAYFDGNSDYITISDSDGVNDYFDLGNNVTIDTWLMFNSVAACGIWQQYDDDNNCIRLYYNGTALVFSIISAATEKTFSYTWTPTAKTWYHVAFMSDGLLWQLYVDGVFVAESTDVQAWPDLAGNFEIGRQTVGADTYFNGWMDEFRVSDVQRYTGSVNIVSPTRPYITSAKHFLVGSTRPLQGTKVYVKNGNSQASTLTGSFWNGVAWQDLTLTDNTDTGASLATTGTVTFSSTESTARVKYLDGSLLYWYQFHLSAGDADIYQVTVNAPMQTVKDIWDGVEREIKSFQVYEDSTYKDNTLNVFDDQYDSLNAGTYSEIDSLQTSEYLYCGFTERQMGLCFSFVPGKYNATAATTAMTVSYWNGAAWTSAGDLDDGTKEGVVSFSKSGIVTWGPPTESEEFEIELVKKTEGTKEKTVRVNPSGFWPLYETIPGSPSQITQAPQFYYYRVGFGNALHNDVQLIQVTGIPAQRKIKAFNYPVHAGDSLWLLGESSGDKNKIIRSAPGTASVFNGEESLEIYVGDETELVAGCGVYMQLGSNLYESVLVCKKNETWIIVPSGDKLSLFCVDNKVGCVAPSTMKRVSFQRGEGNRSAVIWQGADGLYMFNGGAPVKISDDIDNIFDKRADSPISASMIDRSYGEVSVDKGEYHWLFASGTSTSLDKEYVFDISRTRWYQVDRGTGKALQCVIRVRDTNGNNYTYGGIITGYLEELEGVDSSGDPVTSFDGTTIAHTLWLGDLVIHNGIITEETIPRFIDLVCTATNTTSSTITCTYYKDGNTSSDTTTTLTPQATGKRIAHPIESLGKEGPAVFHSLKFTISTNDESVGFEPIYLGILYKLARQRLSGGS